MIIAFTFILTSIFQYYLYLRSANNKVKFKELLITISTVFIYVFIYPIFFYFLYESENYMEFPLYSQTIIIGSIGTIFAIITYIFWRFEKRRSI